MSAEEDRAVSAALAYASYGWPVFPCQAGSKVPATSHGFLDATTDPDQIREWWHRRPDANLAIATGSPGPDVLDIDQHGRSRQRLRRAEPSVPRGLNHAGQSRHQHAERWPARVLHRQQPAHQAFARAITSIFVRRADASSPRHHRSVAGSTRCWAGRPSRMVWTGGGRPNCWSRIAIALG